VKNKITYLSIIFVLISTLFILTGCGNEEILTNKNNNTINTDISKTTNELESDNEETPKDFVVNGYVFKFGTYDAYPVVNGEYENYYISTLVINSDLSCIFTEKEKSTGNISDSKTGKITVDGDNIVIVTDSPSSGCIIDDTYHVEKRNSFTNDLWEFTYIDNNVENIENNTSSNVNTTQIENITEATNNTESSSYNLDGDFMGIHKQDSLASDIIIQGNNITWISPGEELTGIFVIENSNLKATWNDGKTSTLTIVNEEQLKGSEPFSSSGEIVIFNKK
jgi:hypothetical protein